jgi:hypothetical protein
MFMNQLIIAIEKSLDVPSEWKFHGSSDSILYHASEKFHFYTQLLIFRLRTERGYKIKLPFITTWKLYFKVRRIAKIKKREHDELIASQVMENLSHHHLNSAESSEYVAYGWKS